MKDIKEYHNMMLTYPHIALYFAIHFEQHKKINDKYMHNTNEILDGGWIKYPPVPPSGVPTYWSTLGLSIVTVKIQDLLFCSAGNCRNFQNADVTNKEDLITRHLLCTTKKYKEKHHRPICKGQKLPC